MKGRIYFYIFIFIFTNILFETKIVFSEQVEELKNNNENTIKESQHLTKNQITTKISDTCSNLPFLINKNDRTCLTDDFVDDILSKEEEFIRKRKPKYETNLKNFCFWITSPVKKFIDVLLQNNRRYVVFNPDHWRYADFVQCKVNEKTYKLSDINDYPFIENFIIYPSLKINDAIIDFLDKYFIDNPQKYNSNFFLNPIDGEIELWCKAFTQGLNSFSENSLSFLRWSADVSIFIEKIFLSPIKWLYHWDMKNNISSFPSHGYYHIIVDNHFYYGNQETKHIYIPKDYGIIIDPTIKCSTVIPFNIVNLKIKSKFLSQIVNYFTYPSRKLIYDIIQDIQVYYPKNCEKVSYNIYSKPFINISWWEKNDYKKTRLIKNKFRPVTIIMPTKYLTEVTVSWDRKTIFLVPPSIKKRLENNYNELLEYFIHLGPHEYLKKTAAKDSEYTSDAAYFPGKPNLKRPYAKDYFKNVTPCLKSEILYGFQKEYKENKKKKEIYFSVKNDMEQKIFVLPIKTNHQISTIYNPQLAITNQLLNNFWVGVHVDEKYREKTEINIGSNYITEYSLNTFQKEINANLAFKFTNTLSFSLGTRIESFKSYQNRNIHGLVIKDVSWKLFNPINILNLLQEYASVLMSSTSFGYDFGLHYKFNNSILLGAKYQSTIKHIFKTELNYWSKIGRIEKANNLLQNAVQPSIVALTLPDYFSIGIFFKPIKQINIETDLSWIGFNSYKEIYITNVFRLEPIHAGDCLNNLKNIWKYQIRIEFNLNDWFNFRTLYQYAQNPSITLLDIKQGKSGNKILGLELELHKNDLLINIAYNYAYLTTLYTPEVYLKSELYLNKVQNNSAAFMPLSLNDHANNHGIGFNIEYSF